MAESQQLIITVFSASSRIFLRSVSITFPVQHQDFINFRYKMLGGVTRSLLKSQDVQQLLQVPSLAKISQVWASEWVSVHGGQGSPYTRKVQSALR